MSFAKGVALALVVIPLSSVLLRKNGVLLPSTGGKRSVASRSIIPAWNDGSVNVYVDNKEAFSVWEDFFDGPNFIYPFPDGRRFLCDYDYDTDILVFVVDLGTDNTNVVASLKWPSDDYLRSVLMRGATNLVLHTKGTVRLPTYIELQEVSDFVSRATAKQIKTASLPICDLGFYRTYVSKEVLLLDLDTNRQSGWPLVGGIRAN